MKKIFAVLLCAAASWAVLAENKLEVLKIEAPATVAPGQNVAAHITLKVLAFEGRHYLRPGGYYNFAKSKNNANIHRTHTTPWRLHKFKVGDTLKYTVKFTVPENVIAGEKGTVGFRLSAAERQNVVKLIGKTKAEFVYNGNGSFVVLVRDADYITVEDILRLFCLRLNDREEHRDVAIECKIGLAETFQEKHTARQLLSAAIQNRKLFISDPETRETTTE